MSQYRWLIFALLGAVFAAIVNVLSKKALARTDATLAITLQSLLMLTTLAILTTAFGGWSKLGDTPKWALGLLVLSGIAAGMSWFFGYQALQMTDVSKATTVDRLSLLFAVLLAVVFLRERPSALNWTGIALMLIGAVCVAQSNGKPKADQSPATKEACLETVAPEPSGKAV
ncbi:MAG TPA: EamA family transporter [Tepidisphaeraceae bacterium]|jgi:transporter family protein